eukprot:1025283-Rhodomonas_salina.2
MSGTDRASDIPNSRLHPHVQWPPPPQLRLLSAPGSSRTCVSTAGGPANAIANAMDDRRLLPKTSLPWAPLA